MSETEENCVGKLVTKIDLEDQNRCGPHRLNSRSQVRPKCYKKMYHKKARLITLEATDVPDNSVVQDLDITDNTNITEQNKTKIDSLNCAEQSFSESENMDINIGTAVSQQLQNQACSNITLADSICPIKDDECESVSKTEADKKSEDEYTIKGKETELIDFIKNQERTLVENLIAELSDTSKNESAEKEEECVDYEQDENAIMGDVDGDHPIAPGHPLSLKTSILLIWMFSITHSLTSSQLADLLTLINLHLIVANPTLSTLYRFKNFFTNTKLPSEKLKHYFCSYCMASVTESQRLCENHLCGKTLNKNNKDHFIQLDVHLQLKNMFGRSDFQEGLKHRFDRVKHKQNNIEDVYDSIQYKQLFENNGPLSNENNISFTFNTDGVPIFKSSKVSVWPIFLMVNELPFKMRKSREYMLLAGLWCGPTKPSMNLFLQPLYESFMELDKGILVQKNGENVVVKGYLLGASCDLPARSAVLNINNHNGEACCIKCSQTGINYRTEKGGNIRVFPFIKEDATGPLRTHDMVIECAFEEKTHTMSHVSGIKGPSVLMFCPKFDIVKGVAIDYMHLVCLGMVRLFLKLWFTAANSLKDYSMYKYVDVVDSRLTDIKPPHFITRQPRSISEHLKFWKAAELRAWLFYYSIPCITDLLQPVYLYHYCAFVEAIYLLCQSSISPSDVERSQNLLQYFVFMLPALYDERFVTLNAHSLLHLPQTVKDLGPLWSHSCFAFEGANGELLKMFHGTQYIDLQIVNAVHIFQLLPSIAESITDQSMAHKLVKSLTKQVQSLDASRFAFFGKGYEKVLPQSCRISISVFLKGDLFDGLYYNRASIRGTMYHSRDYTRVSKRNCYSVKFIENGEVHYGFILWYAEHKSTRNNTTVKFACIEKLALNSTDIFNSHNDKVLPDRHIQENFMDLQLPNLKYLKALGKQSIVPISDILDLCICIEINKCVIFCEEPNHFEKNL